MCRNAVFHDFLRSQANVPPATVIGTYSGMTPTAAAPAVPQAGGVGSGVSGDVDLSAGAGGMGASSAMSAASTDPLAATGLSRKTCLADFVLLKVVGKGSFGKVMQVRKRDSGQVYAMKVLNKANIVKRKQVEHTRTERSVLGRIVHPFIVGLNFAFQTPSKLYFVLDYCAGGELFFHLGREHRFSESRARFYAAQITLALEHLHSLNVIYRDLKPENVLLDQNGNVRLTDFGLSKENIHATDSGAKSFCGTPEYLAPEVLNRSGHGRAVDWWSLGALLYEMLTGLPPFYDSNRNKLFEKIRHGTLEFPAEAGVSPEAKDLLLRMLDRDPKTRLGCGSGDASDIKTHPFFRSVDWTAMLQLKLTPPWRPPLHNSMDTSHFDQEFTSLPLATPESQSHSSLRAAFEQFAGFSFAGPSSDMIKAKAAVEAAAAAQPRAPSDSTAAAPAPVPAVAPTVPQTTAAAAGAYAFDHQQAMLWQQQAAAMHSQIFAEQQQRLLATQQHQQYMASQAFYQQPQQAVGMGMGAGGAGGADDEAGDVTIA